MKKRVLSLALILVMLFGVIPTAFISAADDAVYLGRDIFASSTTLGTRITQYPSAGVFKMGGVSYNLGIQCQINATGFTDDTLFATYDIGGLYTVLSGVYGAVDRLSSVDTYNMTNTRCIIDILGDGTLLSQYEVTTRVLPEPFSVDVTGVQQLTIRFTAGSFTRFAVADAALTVGTPPQPPQPRSPELPSTAYIGEGIKAYQGSNSTYLEYPRGSSSFRINGVTYFGGVIGNSTGTTEYIYNIDGRYTALSGLFGTFSGSRTQTATLWSDGTYLAQLEVISADAEYFNIDVTGVRQLIIHLSSGFAFADAVFTDSTTTPPSQSFTITTTTSPTNGGTVTGGGSFTSGTSVSLKATPNLGWAFDGWYENGSRVSANATWSFTASANRTLEARFTQEEGGAITITATASPPNGGTVTGGGTFQAGEPVTLTAAANSGYRFDGWFENGVRVSTSMALNFNAEQSRTLEARFSEQDGTPEPLPHPPENYSPGFKEELERALVEDLFPPLLRDPTVDLKEPISRLEFAGVVVLTYENLSETRLPIPTGNPFTDTSDIHVRMAYNSGLMVGVSATTFNPNMILNRETTATALTRVFKKWFFPGWSFATDASYTLDYTRSSPFVDDSKISEWAWDSVYFMAANNILRGYPDGTFRPRNTAEDPIGYANATREQAIVIALRMVEAMHQ